MHYAGRVFYESGFCKVTVEELCTGLGMSKRTFYKYFANRDALVQAVMLERFVAFGPMLIENLKSEKPVEQILQTHFDLLINKLYSRISARMFADFQVLFPESWENLEKARRQIISLFADVLKRGQAEGFIRQDLDPLVMVKIMQGVATHLASPQFLIDAGLDVDEFVRNLQRLISFGLLTSKTTSRMPS